ncbi:MAG: hypothetical protein QM731_17945 [Chitinophagaceae bacterium]
MKPLHAASLQSMRSLFWLLLLANILYIVFTKFLLYPLTPQEVARFEITKKVSDVSDMIQNWKATGKYEKVIQGVYLDYLFIILYTSWLAIAIVYLSKLTRHEILIKAARIFSYLLIIAAICGFIGNLALMRSLKQGPVNWSVMTAYDMAATKFSILIVSLLLLFVCIFFWLLDRIPAQSRKPTTFF